MNSKIKILLVDDQRLIREGIRVILEMESDFSVVGEAENGISAINLYEDLLPDVVLMDIRMPDMGGVEATRKLLSRWPNARIVYLTTFDEDEIIFDGLRAGALGYLLKDVSGTELADAIRKVYQGGALIEPSIARKVLTEFSRLADQIPPPQQDLRKTLTEREMEILLLIAQGSTNKEIANHLFLAEGTIKNYISTILEKLDAADRTAAAIKAHQLGLI